MSDRTETMLRLAASSLSNRFIVRTRKHLSLFGVTECAHSTRYDLGKRVVYIFHDDVWKGRMKNIVSNGEDIIAKRVRFN